MRALSRVPAGILMIAAAAHAAEWLKVEKAGAVGRTIENQYFVADLSHRMVNGKEEDTGTLRALTYKPLHVTFFRNPANGLMHKGISLQRAGASGYHDIGAWTPVQTFHEERKGGFYTHHREGYFSDFPEVKLDVEYRFPDDAPYFLVAASMTVEKPLTATLVRNNEMTMDLFFTHVAWPSAGGETHIAGFDERKPEIEKYPIPVDVPWLAFVNLEKGYGYGHVMLDYKSSKTVNPETAISDGMQSGVINGRYWSRHMISGKETPLVPGDAFKELSAYVLFGAPKDAPLSEFLNQARKLQAKFGAKRFN